jgi:Bacteriophage baseplate protein W
MASNPNRLFPEPIGWPLLPVPGDDGTLAFPSLPRSVRESIQVILSTRPGEQLMRPQFGGGLENLLTEPNTVATRARIQDTIAEALARWEPRIVVDAIAVDTVEDDAGAVRVEIAYRLKRTQQAARVGLTLALEGGNAH